MLNFGTFVFEDTRVTATDAMNSLRRRTVAGGRGGVSGESVTARVRFDAANVGVG